MLERDVSLAGDLTELKICAQELLSAKVKRQIGSNGYLYLQLKITMGVFPLIKLKKSPPLDSHRFIKAPMNARLVYRSNPYRSTKVLMTVRLVHRNARSMPWAGEEALTLTRDKTRPAVT